MHNTEQAYLVLVHFTLLHLTDTMFFTSLGKVYGHPVSCKSVGAIFSKIAKITHSLCASVSHFGKSHNISNLPPAKRLLLTGGSEDG